MTYNDFINWELRQKRLQEIDEKIKKVRLLWLHSGIRGMNKYVPKLNRLLDKRLEISK